MTDLEPVEEPILVAADSSTARMTAAGPPHPSDGARSSGATVDALGGAEFRDLLNAGLDWLDAHHDIVNALNVFPVPDGDTGTNMLLTMKSALHEIIATNANTVGEVARAAAHGALMGARGNSGVILSQILRGVARSLDDQPTITGQRFAAALTEGSRIAYKGVNRPVEGTILTVVREAAAAAELAAQSNADLRFVMAETVRAADASVANTPKLLPVLAQANKVDSGGKGLFFILEGMYRALYGETTQASTSTATRPEAIAAAPAPARPSKGRRDLPSLVHGFDVQFLVEGKSLDVDAIRTQITAMGDCPLVEGDRTLVKVHVHVPNPGVPLAYAVGLGFVTDVVVENMDDMHIPEMRPGYDPVPPRFETAVTATAAATSVTASVTVTPDDSGALAAIDGPGVIVVAPGKGLGDVFRSLGAHVIVSGGQTMNPSTQDLYQAIARLPTEHVIILPNNGNILMAAQQAQALATGKSVAVVPSKSVPQGISALLALNPHADLARNVYTMTAALASVQTGEVTIAVQDARFDDIEVHSGDVIGLLNDELTAKGPDSTAVVQMLLDQMGAAEREIITLYYGQPVTAQEADALLVKLRSLFPDQEIEIVGGGQPFYHYIISAE
ncbi:MAG: DAK2 domain-containing protein [Anaerolineae bacterium]|nr:DAK2 domain-containing protein [Anaerolineae bacterium]